MYYIQLSSFRGNCWLYLNLELYLLPNFRCTSSNLVKDNQPKWWWLVEWGGLDHGLVCNAPDLVLVVRNPERLPELSQGLGGRNLEWGPDHSHPWEIDRPPELWDQSQAWPDKTPHFTMSGLTQQKTGCRKGWTVETKKGRRNKWKKRMNQTLTAPLN